MGNYTREEILQMVEDEDVEFIRLQFTDMFGAIKNIAVTARELPRALNNQCVIDGEQIAGTKRNGVSYFLSIRSCGTHRKRAVWSFFPFAQQKKKHRCMIFIIHEKQKRRTHA